MLRVWPWASTYLLSEWLPWDLDLSGAPFPIWSVQGTAWGNLSLYLIIWGHPLPIVRWCYQHGNRLSSYAYRLMPQENSLNVTQTDSKTWHALKTANGVWLHLQFLWEGGHIPDGGHLALAALTSSWCLTLRLPICLELSMEMGVSEETPLI